MGGYAKGAVSRKYLELCKGSINHLTNKIGYFQYSVVIFRQERNFQSNQNLCRLHI